VAGVFIGVTLINVISAWFENSFINKLEVNIIYDLKKKFFNHLLGLSQSFYTSHKTGSLISRLSRGAGAVERMTDTFVYNVFPLVFQLIIVSASLVYFDMLTAVIVLATILLFISWSFLMQRIGEPLSLYANTRDDIEKANIADIFTNVDSIKYFGKEEKIKEKFSDLAQKTKEAFLKNWNYYRLSGAGQTLILGLGTLSLVTVSVIRFLHGHITIGTLAFIYSVYGSLLGSLFGFVYGIRNFYRSLADFQDLFQYGKIEREVKDKADAKNCVIKSGEVEFRDIGFNYSKRAIFKDFSLKVNKNEKVALVGHSGSGKSTLVKLLYRFYDVSSGRILIDGEDIRDFTQESLRAEMAIVPQECILFDDTIYNNIAFSNSKASKTEILKAIRFAQLDKMIANLPNKENTIVGERGVKLSGGEKQRVSIARAILANKRILVLDEATSSLDSETEHEIQEDLKELMKGRTTIVIAHRLSTIMHADKIVVLKEGKIVQMGKHNELIRKPGEYSKLWKLQRGGYIK
jgi:ATP-binding cassette subfamily B protein